MRRRRGILAFDDGTPAKPSARTMGPLPRRRSGKHRRVARGRTLLTPRWADGDAPIPRDDHRYEQAVDGHSKNGHFRAPREARRSQ